MLSDLLSKVQSLVFKPNLDDNRTRPRARCQIPISCQTKEGAMACTLRDLSTHGARIQTDRKLAKGLDILLLPPKGSSEKDKAVKAKVMWSRKYRGRYYIGMKFSRPGSESWIKSLLQELGLSTSVPNQRRKFVRFNTEMPAQLRVYGNATQAKVLDLSMGGALVKSSKTINNGAKVGLDLAGYGSTKSLSLSCSTVKSQKHPDGSYRCSLQFDNPSQEQRALLVQRLNFLFRKSE